MRIFAYKSTAQIESTLINSQKRLDNVFLFIRSASLKVAEFGRKIIEVRDAVAKAPVNAHIRFIRFRIGCTDHYLEAKAEGLERVLHTMATKRKQIAAEQQETRKELKTIRATYTYPANPRMK